MAVDKNFKIDNFFYTPKKDENRINRYTKYENIFLGNHEEAFNPKINFNEDDDNLYIKELVGQLISYTSADYLFGESLSIGTDEDNKQFLDLFYESNPDFDTQLYEAGLASSYFGDVVVELKVVDNEPKVLFHDPRNYFVVKDANNEIIEKQLCFVIRKGDKFYLHKRIHQKGVIRNELYEVRNEKKLRIISVKKPEYELVRANFNDIGLDEMPEEQFTGVDDDFLVRHIPNMRLLNAVFGISDYLGKESLMNAFNVLTSFAHLILEKNADPGMEVPTGTFDPNSNIYLEDFKVFQTDAETKGIPRYISPDLNGLTQLFEQRTHVMDMIALYSEISLTLMGKDSSSAAPDNYRAMKLRFYRTLQKMNRKKRYWEPAIEWMLQTSQKLLKQGPSEYTFEWSDGLPDDLQTTLEEMQLARGIGLKSNETLIEEFGRKIGWTEQRIEEEKARILQQSEAKSLPTEGANNLFKQTTQIDGSEDKQTI